MDLEVEDCADRFGLRGASGPLPGWRKGAAIKVETSPGSLGPCIARGLCSHWHPGCWRFCSREWPGAGPRSGPTPGLFLASFAAHPDSYLLDGSFVLSCFFRIQGRVCSSAVRLQERVRIAQKLRELVFRFTGQHTIEEQNVFRRLRRWWRTNPLSMDDPDAARALDVAPPACDGIEMDGSITRQMFADVICDPRVQALLNDLEVGWEPHGGAVSHTFPCSLLALPRRAEEERAASRPTPRRATPTVPGRRRDTLWPRPERNAEAVAIPLMARTAHSGRTAPAWGRPAGGQCSRHTPARFRRERRFCWGWPARRQAPASHHRQAPSLPHRSARVGPGNVGRPLPPRRQAPAAFPVHRLGSRPPATKRASATHSAAPKPARGPLPRRSKAAPGGDQARTTSGAGVPSWGLRHHRHLVEMGMSHGAFLRPRAGSLVRITAGWPDAWWRKTVRTLLHVGTDREAGSASTEDIGTSAGADGTR